MAVDSGLWGISVDWRQVIDLLLACQHLLNVLSRLHFQSAELSFFFPSMQLPSHLPTSLRHLLPGYRERNGVNIRLSWTSALDQPIHLSQICVQIFGLAFIFIFEVYSSRGTVHKLYINRMTFHQVVSVPSCHLWWQFLQRNTSKNMLLGPFVRFYSVENCVKSSICTDYKLLRAGFLFLSCNSELHMSTGHKNAL